MTLRYVSAETTDIPEIFFQAKALIDRYEDIASIDYEKVLLWVNRKIEANISDYCCVLVDDEKAAYYRLCEDGELDDVYVLPAFQGHGIGSEILRKCIAETEKDLYLYVFRGNTRAIAFYERFGFSVCETVGNTRFIMARNG